tara:strand:- start:19726 stop:21642 length:1917 start_codon:yes stop_codon:yes gene_type:complete
MVTKNIICISPECENTLPQKARKYCSDTCKWREQKRKQRYKEQGREYEPEIKESNKGTVTQVRRGALYDKFVNEGYALDLIQGRLTRQEIADELKCTSSHISRLLGAFQEDYAKDRQAESWEISEDAEQSLKDFGEFRDRYFLTEMGIPFETADFHVNWIKSINKALLTGGQQMILSPPRHGKTELLIHFVIWLIMRNPNIRIMWVGGNEDIAMNSVMSVMDTLEQNEKLKEDFCGPGGTFKPATRAGKMWSRSGFTVSTRTVAGIKSPTMIGIGRGGKILSRDCDLIIADDIEDHSSTMQPASRENTKNWWTTTLGSRKEEHTAMVLIGSRQHPEDLYSAILESEAWETIVEEAHDSLCVIPEFEEEDHVDCMLWSGKRTFKWLINRKRDAMTTGGLKNFEMVYLNKAYSDSLRLFNPEQIEKCYDPNIGLGHIPKGAYLVAGLDPAATGYQAGFLWAVETNASQIKLTLVDLENHQGGGLDEAFALIKMWHDKYGCYHWVIEENGFQKAIRQDQRIKEYCNVQGIKLEGHETHKNKWDEKFGVTALAPMFNEQMIVLPFYDADAQSKSITYTKQLVYFASKGKGGKGYKSDVVMASWFPMKVIRALTKLVYSDIGIEYTPSFDGYNSVQWNETPWS